MMGFLSKIKVNVCIGYIVIALVIYIPFLFFFSDVANDQIRSGVSYTEVFPVHGSDSAGYVSLSEGLIHYGQFSHDHEPLFAPDTFRTPGYPAMLSLLKLLFGSYAVVSIFQIILTILVSIMILKIGDSLGHRTWGAVAGFLYLIDPTVIFHSLVILSDTPFVFFVVLSVYLSFFSVSGNETTSKHKMLFMFLAGISIGFSVLIRPISMFFPVLFIPFYYLIFKNKINKKNIVNGLVLFVIGWLVITGPWFMRNKMVSGVLGLSSVASFNLFHYYVPEFLAYKDQVSPDSMRLKMRMDVPADILPSEYASIENSEVLNSISMKYLKGNLVSYGIFHTIKTIPVFLSSGVKHILFYLNDALRYPAYSLNSGNMTTLLLHGELTSFLKELKVSLIPTLESLYFLVLTFLAFVPVLQKGQDRLLFIWFWVIILYFSFLVGSVAYARFRLPISPFLFLLAVFGATILWHKVKHTVFK